jgi:hypothetical protein
MARTNTRTRGHTSTVRSGQAIDTSGYRDAAKALRKGAKTTSKVLRKELRAAGELMAADARIIAEEHSEKIPPTVKVRVAGATVAVQAGGANAPIAGLFELGNQGNKSKSATSSGYFRHPVFGNKEVWVYQRMHRFLRPAADKVLVIAQARIVSALDKAAKVITTGYGGRP